MGELDYAFRGNVFRADICQGTATSFFQTVQGTLWPLCPSCCDRHKVVAVSIIRNGRLSPDIVERAVFDIPIDTASLAAFKAQDPARINAAFALADEAMLDKLRGVEA